MQTRIIMGQDTIEKKAFETSAKVYVDYVLHKQWYLAKVIEYFIFCLQNLKLYG